jgi:dCMP deaminase
VEKHGKTPYEVYAKGNARYRERQRAWRLQDSYGLTQESYTRLLDVQGGVCAICKRKPEEGQHLPVDHDHATGRVRGLLCHQCNRAIGQLQDDLKNLRAAASYLLRHDTVRSWDLYFLEIAQLVATRSKDPSSQVGAVIVRKRNIISTGYNGFPRGVNDNVPERYERPAKYKWTIHGEENAILNASRNGTAVEGATLYVTPFAPCVECAKAIVQSGIIEVVVDARVDNPRWTESFAEANEILKAARVLVRGPE